ncbi:MAG: GNAT family N-acetyltransferase [Bacteroidales bacterium]|nr:GNAT family N-acetyltransferase [Bacteroidales bacterium]
MFLIDNNLSLRIAEPSDAGLIYCWENDRSIWRVSETSAPTSRFQIEQFLISNSDWMANRQLRLMIEVEGADHPIGSVDLFNYDPLNQRIGIGVLVETAYRQQGFASRAVKLTLDYLFQDLMVHQVHCLIGEDNLPSQRLFEGLGFVYGGNQKDWIKTPEGYLDVRFYQKLANH